MSLIACRWNWCRSSFTTIDALDDHVKHVHIWPMKPMRNADIVLMRKMDMQSLHSSLDTDSSIIPKGLTPENDAFRRSSSPFSQSLPMSPAIDSLIAKDQLLPHRSPTRRYPSNTSGSSQDVVERHLTQDDRLGSQSQSLPPPMLLSEHEHTEVELTWPTDDESDALATAHGIQSSEYQNHHPGDTSDPARGQNFRSGSLDVPLVANNQNSSPLTGSQSQSQPVILQTQAPYSSQSMGWSQSL